MKRYLSILLLIPSLLVGQIAIGVGVGVPFGGGIQATAALITANPANDSVNEAQNVLFSVTATGTPLSYQWQYSVDGTTYANLSNGGKYSGVATKQLSITGVDYTYHRNYYRAIVTGGKEPPDTSTSALLYVTDSASIKYFAAMTTQWPAATKIVINDFVVSQKKEGLWQKKDRVWIIASTSAGDCVIDLFGRENCSLVNSPTFNQYTGITSGTGQYINTNYIASSDAINYSLNSASMSFYLQSSGAASNIADIGVFDGTTYTSFNHARSVSTIESFFVLGHHNGLANVNVENTTDQEGLYQISRQTANLVTHIKGNFVVELDLAQAAAAVPTKEFFVGCLNNNGTAGTVTARTYSYIEFGAGLSDAEMVKNYNHINTLMTHILAL